MLPCDGCETYTSAWQWKLLIVPSGIIIELIRRRINNHRHERLFQIIHYWLSLEISALGKNCKRRLQESINLTYEGVYVLPPHTGRTTGARFTCRWKQNMFYKAQTDSTELLS
jgi:hypothetical protein